MSSSRGIRSTPYSRLSQHFNGFLYAKLRIAIQPEHQQDTVFHPRGMWPSSESQITGEERGGVGIHAFRLAAFGLGPHRIKIHKPRLEDRPRYRFQARFMVFQIGQFVRPMRKIIPTISCCSWREGNRNMANVLMSSS